MVQIYSAVKDCDVIVLVTPLYFWNMSGQIRTAIDRLFALEVGDHYLFICDVEQVYGNEAEKALFAWNGYSKVAAAAQPAPNSSELSATKDLYSVKRTGS